MNEGDIVELDITGVGMNGEGVSRDGRRVIFVPYTLKGERVRAVIKSVHKRFLRARVIKVLSASPDRVTPVCPHYYGCGGCDLGHVSESFRREALTAELKNNLSKIAGIEECPVEFVPCENKFPHRNKLSMPFGVRDGKVVLGLYRHNTHDVVPVSCVASSERMRNIAAEVAAFAEEKKLEPYNEKTGTGLLRHLVLREAERISATLVINGERVPGEKELARRLPGYVDLFVCPNTARNNVILGDRVRLVSGRERLEVDISGVKAELSPLAFFQTNTEIAPKLYAAAMNAVVSPTLVDLYSGIGITSNLAARKCDRVYAVECVPQAVADADITAKLNGNPHRIKNICGKAEEVLPQIAGEAAGADILVDPPRKGCEIEVLVEAAKLKPERFIYISCNHATMCRDIEIFRNASRAFDTEYDLLGCTVFDMFPDTHHCEVLAVIAKSDRPAQSPPPFELPVEVLPIDRRRRK